MAQATQEARRTGRPSTIPAADEIDAKVTDTLALSVGTLTVGLSGRPDQPPITQRLDGLLRPEAGRSAIRPGRRRRAGRLPRSLVIERRPAERSRPRVDPVTRRPPSDGATPRRQSASWADHGGDRPPSTSTAAGEGRAVDTSSAWESDVLEREVATATLRGWYAPPQAVALAIPLRSRDAATRFLGSGTRPTRDYVLDTPPRPGTLLSNLPSGRGPRVPRGTGTPGLDPRPLEREQVPVLLRGRGPVSCGR